MKKFYFLLSLLMSFTISTGNVWAGQVTISPTQALNDGGVDPITVACAKGDGTSNPAISSSQLRLYQAASGKTTGNTITFSSSKSITSIVFTFANNMTASNGSFSEGSYDSETSTWTGSTTSLTLTVTGTTSGTRIYITNMVVTYEDGGDEPGGDEPGGGDDPAPTSSNWAKVDPADLATNDVVVIVENNSKAMSNDQGTSAAPTAVAVTVADDKLSADPADNIKWTVTVSNGSFVFATGDNHLYCTNTNNGVRVGTNANSAFTISTEGYLYNTATSRYVGVYNNTDWRCYTSINSNIQNQTFSFFKESDGSTPKQAAGLAYAEADQKKLAKLGNAFTAPTLSNPNNLEGITYASNNTDVATVADNGAVTIKAAGVATITASFAGNGDYKAGSASYTIGVTDHAGTQADPFDVADAKIAIDAVGTVENAYATGFVCNVVTTADNFDSGAGFITFYFSADGLTSGQQIEAYKCYGLNSAPFEAVTDVKTGATVVVTGTLKKYNSTYEFDQNCHLVSYEAPAVPKTSIANDQANPYTVAQAITYAADGVTYDLDDYVYVQGVVYSVQSFNNGAMDIFIKDANAENQFELYKCAGINDGNATTPFDALTDVQVGDVVIGYGQLTVYNSVYELKQGNYLVDLDREEVVLTDYYEKVTETAGITDGTYLIVYEAGSLAFNGSLETLDAGNNTIEVAITNDNKIGVTTATEAATFFIDATAGSIQSASGKYIGANSYSNRLDQSEEASAYVNALSIDANGNAVISLSNASWDGDLTLRYNSATNQARFRYYKNGQQSVALYKLANEVVKANPELAWSAESVVISIGDAWSAPSLGYANGFDGLAAVTYASNNESVATVTNAGVISLAGGTGTAIITATFAGNNNYREGSASYTITVNEVGDNLSGTWAMVTDAAQLAAGKKVIITGITVGASVDVKTMGKQNTSNRAAVNGAIADMNGITILTPNTGTNAFTLVDAGDGKFAFRASNTKYLCAASSSSNNLKEQDENTADGQWTISIDNNAFATITAQGSYTRNTMRYNPNNGSPIFACYASTSTTGSLVTLFVLQEDEPEQPVDPEQPELNYEDVRTGLEVGRFYTICMPKNILAIRGASFWGISKRDADGTMAYLEEEVAPFAAGKPFIFFTTADKLEVAYGEETTNTPVENGALRGTLVDMDANALDAAGSNIYLMYQNALHPLGTNNHLDANRAYLIYGALEIVSNEPTPAPGRQVRKVQLQGNVATGIDHLDLMNGNDTARKVVIDGQILIMRGDKLFDITGRQMK